ncbi:MAG: phospho-sugar mutase [Marinifilaceae bacterium]|jgi:phosphoglucomutase|nr:phospho-sugar mutase [Marinifilaceae bacterium]
MFSSDIIESVKKNAEKWLGQSFDTNTREQVKALLDADDQTELVESFYKNLEFGTGGLRGIMGVGINRMNKYTVGAATQALANYLNKVFADEEQISICIGYDCRHNSKFFAQTVADIFSANGILAYMFEDLRPTPEMSFAIRHLSCQSGVIITASHNPKEYNGYKAYWNDGSQLVPPHDRNVIEEVSKIKYEDIKFDANPDLIKYLAEDMDKLYLDTVKTLSLADSSSKEYFDKLKIVFTPLHGTTYKLVPDSLRNFGFTNIINVPEQDVIDGDFPTVWSANPEEPAALKMAVDKAIETDADIVMACDPDGDRIGVAAKNLQGEWEIINGNQTAILLTYYIIERRRDLGLSSNKDFIVKTIVTSELLKEIAEKNNIRCFDVYTGFKWIADAIRDNSELNYIGGGEESFGYMPGKFTMDKDGVSSCSLMAELAAMAKSENKSLFELLKDIYKKYGYSKEKMVYIVREGLKGAEEITNIMEEYRNNTPKYINNSELIFVKDYSTLELLDVKNNKKTRLNYKTKSNVLQFFLADGSKISVRPSGTEPKIKYYFEVKEDYNSVQSFDTLEQNAEIKIQNIIKSMNIE